MRTYNPKRLPLCLDVNDIARIHNDVKNVFRTEKVYPMGRCAEVVRGLFPTTHIAQFFLMDETKEQSQMLEKETQRWLIKKPEEHSVRDNRLAAFDFFHASKSCVIYIQTSLAGPMIYEFLYQLERQSVVEPKTKITIPSFSLNHAFWNNNSFFHEETSSVMESINDYLQSDIGQVEDIPLIGDMHRFLALSVNRRDAETYFEINKRLKQHEHGELLTRIFRETLEETI